MTLYGRLGAKIIYPKPSFGSQFTPQNLTLATSYHSNLYEELNTWMQTTELRTMSFSASKNTFDLKLFFRIRLTQLSLSLHKELLHTPQKMLSDPPLARRAVQSAIDNIILLRNEYA